MDDNSAEIRKKKALTRFCYGDLARSLFNGLITTYLMALYVPAEGSGIPQKLVFGAVAFAIMRGIGAIIDAFIDPWIASKSDRLSNAKGKRVPFMRLAVLPWVISGALLGLAPFPGASLANTIWVGVMMAIYFISSSLYLVPFSALATEIVTDTEERMKFFTKETFFFVLGSALVYIAPILRSVFMKMGVSPLNYWRGVFVVVSLIAGYFVFVPAFTFPETEYAKAEPSYTPLKLSFKRTFKYKNYLILTIGFFFMWVAFQFFNTTLLYYLRLLIGLGDAGDSYATIVMAIAMIIGVASYPLVNYGVKKYGKKKMIVFACCVYTVLYASIALHEYVVKIISPVTFAILLGVLIGFPISITNIVPNAAFADIAQLDQIRTGEDNTAMFMTVRAFIQQLGQSAVVALCPIIIAYNSPGFALATKEGVQITAVIITIMIFIALLFYLFFDDQQTTAEIDEYNRKLKEEKNGQI
ncbi:MAG: MFS transporter [Erysipelotrichaceae bacterium]|jgi:GPH family glycoside/pentoside/hexuronide:cation symporter|nr:MFS transporter [Erysipelotrichaceae bacterium]MCR5097032.1 MFS transporter [Erysipelotrichaceae bacterium]